MCQVHLPAAAWCRAGRGRVGRRGEQPARGGGAGLAIRHVVAVRPAAQHEGGDAVFLAGESQPARGHVVHRPDLPQHGGETACAEGDFHRPQHAGHVTRVHQHQPGGIEAGQAGRIEIWHGGDPQHRRPAAQPGANPPDQGGGEGGGKLSGFRPSPNGADFMQGPEWQAALFPLEGETRIHAGIAQGEHPGARRCRAQPVAQEGQMCGEGMCGLVGRGLVERGRVGARPRACPGWGRGRGEAAGRDWGKGSGGHGRELVCSLFVHVIVLGVKSNCRK